MTKKPAVSDEQSAAPAPPAREKEYTQPIVRGGAYDEDGTLVHETKPEPDAHRTEHIDATRERERKDS